MLKMLLLLLLMCLFLILLIFLVFSLWRYAPCPNGNGHIITKEASLKIDPFISTSTEAAAAAAAAFFDSMVVRGAIIAVEFSR